MHVNGFKTALTRCINAYARKYGFLKDNEDNLSGDDIREGLTAIISVRIKNPEFEGQTKTKLGNPEYACCGYHRRGICDVVPRRTSTDAKLILDKAIMANTCQSGGEKSKRFNPQEKRIGKRRTARKTCRLQREKSRLV
jgi:DNA gyrase subunit B